MPIQAHTNYTPGLPHPELLHLTRSRHDRFDDVECDTGPTNGRGKRLSIGYTPYSHHMGDVDGQSTRSLLLSLFARAIENVEGEVAL